ncbi:MAG: cytochrome b/b6 domain-containing protein [Gammaproteobacteria bacterium]|nr:cytochrome b/b6 domain-containing protein [Gammaproteobacteria bacterium]
MTSQLITLWDWPLRLFHWCLVCACLAAYISGISGGLWLEWHAHIGSFILSLLVFRLAWGFGGSYYSRFKNFPLCFVHVKKTMASNEPLVGHTRAGALSVILMLLAVIIQAISGLFASQADIDFFAPLSLLLSEEKQQQFSYWHRQWVNMFLILAILHLSAIGFYLFIKKQDIVWPMITGQKKIINISFHKETGPINIKAFALSIFCALLIYWLIESALLFDLLLQLKN